MITFPTRQSSQLQYNRKILLQAFDGICNLVQVRKHQTGGSADEHWIDFTYYDTIKSWSHSVKLLATNDGVYLKAYRLDPKDDLEKYKVDTRAHGLIVVLIPIEEKQLIVKVLTEYDRFKYR